MKFWLVRLASVAAAVAAVLVLEAVVKQSDSFTQRLVMLAGLYVTLAVSLNLINGITGQFSIGHAAFYMVGAYAAASCAKAFFATSGLPPGIWIWAVAVIGALAASIAGLLVGLPSLRLRGDYLAIVTLGFGEIIRIVVQAQPSLGGAYGMNVEPIIHYPGAIWFLAILCIAVCRNLLKTAQGLRFLAVREDEIASQAMGVDITRVKVTAFVIGSAFAGAAGAMLAHMDGFISPMKFTMDTSFIILTMVVLGGTGSITGSAIAAVVLFYLPEKMRDLPNMPLANVTAGLVAVFVAVALLKRVLDHVHDKGKRLIWYAGTVLATVVGYFVSAALFAMAPFAQSAPPIEGAKLRMVVFAITLVALMLLRPQGVFAHHEFSWSWVRKLLGEKKVPTTGVSA